MPVSWTSSDEGVASVSDQGLVTGNRVGQAVIRAVHAAWVEDSIRVTVIEPLDMPGEVLFRETFSADSTDGLSAWIVSDSTSPVPAVVERAARESSPSGEMGDIGISF